MKSFCVGENVPLRGEVSAGAAIFQPCRGSRERITFLDGRVDATGSVRDASVEYAGDAMLAALFYGAVALVFSKPCDAPEGIS